MKKLLRELAFQLRSALPFAIVDNGTWADGTHRPQSYLSKLISYANVQDAIDAGWGHIKIKSGRYPHFVVNTDNVVIEGSGWGSDVGDYYYYDYSTIIDGNLGQSGDNHAIEILGNGVIIRNLSTTNTNSGGSKAPIQIGTSSTPANNVTVEECRVIKSPSDGINVSYANHLKLLRVHISAAGGLMTNGISLQQPAGTNSSNNIHISESAIVGPDNACIYAGHNNPSSSTSDGGYFISDNYLEGSVHGIYLSNKNKYGIISGNRIYNSTGYHIYDDTGTDYCVFIGNSFGGSGTDFLGNATNSLKTINS